MEQVVAVCSDDAGSRPGRAHDLNFAKNTGFFRHHASDGDEAWMRRRLDHNFAGVQRRNSRCLWNSLGGFGVGKQRRHSVDLRRKALLRRLMKRRQEQKSKDLREASDQKRLGNLSVLLVDGGSAHGSRLFD